LGERRVGDEPIVASEEVGVVGAGGGVDREHPRRVADAEHPPPGERVVHVPGERVQGGDLRNVRFGIPHRLVQVRDRPAQRDVGAEEPGQLGGGIAGRGVAPGAERHEQLVVGVEREVAVHHRRDTDRGELRRSAAALSRQVRDEVGVGRLQSGPDVVEGVGPDPVDELVLPLVCAAREHDRRVGGIHEARLDASRAELDPEYRAHRRSSSCCP
jgi:hypothetical protein